jgi:actin-like ATPase involved in cell morphogenesis
MTTVKVNRGATAPTPTQEVLAAASEQFSVVDVRGRTIVLKKPSVLAQFRLIEALGDVAKNDVYRQMCIPMIYVVSIDGMIVTTMTRKEHVEALISRLDDDGFKAIQDGIRAKYPSDADDGEDEEAIKNS